MKKKSLLLLLALTIIFMSAPLPVTSQNIENKQIKEVYIKGNNNVSGAVIRKYIKMSPGRTFRMSDANEDIKRLYETGYFSKIEIDLSEYSGEEVILTYQVEEKPIVSKLEIKGNDHIRAKKLLKKIPFSEKMILNENKIAEGKNEIVKYYIDRGYMQVQVEYDISKDEVANTAEVTYVIDEGRRVKIKKIEILGAKAFKPRKIRKVMKTKSKFFFIRQGYFKEDEFKDDKERIKALYYQDGYIDIKILDVKKQLSANGKYLTIYIKLEEGKKYQISEIVYNGNNLYTKEEIKDGSILVEGEDFLPEKLTDDLKRIENIYYQKGYIDTRVGVDTVLDERSGGIKVDYYINESGKVYVKQIRASGNVKTKDIVLRREILVAPGEVFDGVKTDISKNRLQNLGLFDAVDIYPDPESKEEYRDLIIEVQEGRTGELSFGAGFSSVENFLGFVEVSQNNFDLFNWPHFSGDAQKLKLRVEYGEVRKDVVLSFIEPWFLERRLSLGLDFFNSSTSYIDSAYDEARAGGSFSLTWPIGKFSRMTGRYSYEDAEITDVADDASDLIKQEEGLRTISKIGLTINRDSRNSFFFPTRGMQTVLLGEVAGLVLGNTQYYRTAITQYNFFNPIRDHIFMFKFKTALIKEYGDSNDVPIFDRYFLGGPTSIRGFKYRDIGPHDIFGDPLGGKYYAYTTLEYTVPIFEKLAVATFFDVGNLWADPETVDLGVLNGAVGVGLRVRLPVGPISFDYGYPVITDEYHEGENGLFTFNLGTTF